MAKKKRKNKTYGVGEQCAYCDRGLASSIRDGHPLQATKDHTVPQCLGGYETVWACATCNSMKGNMLPDEWNTFMNLNPKWWETAVHRARAIQSMRDRHRYHYRMYG